MTHEDIIGMARGQGLPETEIEGVFRVNSDDLGRILAAERMRLHDKFMQIHREQKHRNNYWHFAARKLLAEGV